MTCPSERIFAPERRHCLRNVVSLTLGANRLRRCSSSFIQAKKNCLRRQVSKMVGERGLRAPAGRALRAVAFATLSRCARRNPPSEVLIHFYSGEKNCLRRQVSKMVGERGLRAPAGRALRAVAFATLSRCARRNPPSEVLIHFYSGEKKPVFADRFLKMVGERGFEPPTHWSQTSCATKLRYSPIFLFCFAWCEERDLNPHVR